VVSGWDPRDPFSLPLDTNYEAELGTHDLGGLRVALSPNLGSATVRSEVADLVMEHAALLVRDAGLQQVDVDIQAPEGSLEWALGGLGRVREQLGEKWPECADDLTPQIRFGLEMAEKMFSLDIAARIEFQRTENNERMARVFDQVDLVICPTNPDVAFDARGPIPTVVDGVEVGPGNNGALTIPANFFGNPSISIPVGTVDGLPVGMQVMARHHREDQLLDLALLVERERPWPLVVEI
jgi:aspartyl-tRNA(Asn)/glutamyl-tRNA(Gln) amidotransferase subunit A